MIEGAFVFMMGMLFGRYFRWQRKRRPKELPSGASAFRCGCGHNRAFHKEGTGSCKHTGWDGTHDCGCQHYVGPEPLPEYNAM